ncbi:Structural maintenance of chromosomes protein 3 [Tritrichomonas foetus]|uniref:Structural maintenance of chromosomes protein 3 n=1 Tax=Tritrichomonas foetus TaxID=1144522 RepID=A0A1J4KWA0_9EUKA|nr:Structural maintenance of chromosomes protein 3 [Tritrichomonas foetus]|eukprot:OHT13982.1 Structural maintenance of chromosomes protein 3 [Tritrichomonas foetus]
MAPKFQMFVKQVKICGFKTFGGMTIFGDFSPTSNCICGLNGTGKSSFYSAIEFIFLEEFSHLRPSDRQSLLYTGQSMLNSPTAFVEIIFDNSCRRLPIDSNEVAIRRSIGINKDEYFIQRKHSTRQDILNLFETANYSISSGLFSVRQGKVKVVAEMKDSERLELLFEMSGIKSYDEQKKESLAMLSQAELRREKISNTIEDIDERLEQIMKEKQELEEYEEINRTKRALEYIIYEKQRSKAEAELEIHESDILNESSVVDRLQKEHDQAIEQISSIKEKVADLENKITINGNERENLENKRQELIKKKAKTDYNIEFLKQKEKTVEKIVQTLQNKKDELLQKYETLKEEKQNLKTEVEGLNNKRIQLEAILFQNDSYKMTEEDLLRVKTKIEDINSKINEFEQGEQNNRLEELKKSLDGLEENFQAFSNKKAQTKQKIADLHQEKISQFNERKLCYKKQYELEQKKKTAEANVQKCVFEYERLMGETAEAIKYINEKFKNHPGFHGQIIDLINFDENLDLAIDSVAGGKLFQLVVDTHDLATEILQKMMKDNIYGIVSFYPLNTVKGKKRKITQTTTAEPLINRIEYDEKYKNVVSSVFGDVALCSSLTAATEYAATERVNCVTFTGDMCFASGMVSGGFYSSLRSICKNKRKTLKAKTRLNNTINDLNEISEKIENICHLIHDIDKRISIKESKISKSSHKIASLNTEIVEKKAEIKEIEKSYKSLKETKNNLEEQKADLQNQLEVFAKENPNSPIDTADRESQQQLLSETSAQLARTKLDLHEASISLHDTKKEIKNTDKELADCERKKIEELRQKAKEEENEIDKLMNEFEEERQKIEENKETYESDLKVIKDKLESKLKVKKSGDKELSYAANRLEELNRQKNICVMKIEEVTKNISNIGPLPITEIDDWKGKSHHEIMEKLQDVNDQLHRFRFVNKKAIEQFRQFEKKGADLKLRKEDLDNSITPIRNLIHDLDEKKDKAIVSTFASISQHFSDIYFQLTGRNAALTLKTNEDADNLYNSNEQFSTSNYTGLSIRIEGRSIETMSGGEKTLVAIALLFAIQVDTSLFYLFDEIDSDLDPKAREALSSMIDHMTTNDKQSQNVQFIFTTHKAEMMSVAEKFFAVTSENGQGVVKETTKEDALRFTMDFE